MEDTELLNQNQQVEEYKLKEEDVFRYETNVFSMSANSEQLFAQNANELDFHYKSKTREQLRVKNRTEEQIDAQIQFQRVLADQQAKDYRSGKNRKKRAKAAKKSALNAQKLLRNLDDSMSVEDNFDTQQKLNKIHLEMNINRIQSLAKNEDDERVLTQKARKAYLVREMENCATLLVSGDISKDKFKKVSTTATTVFSEYLDMQVSEGKLTEEFVATLKANTEAMSKYMHGEILDKTYNIKVRYANYFNKNDYQESIEHFEKWKKTALNAGEKVFKPSIVTYRIAKMTDQWINIRKHYVTDEVYNLYNKNYNTLKGTKNVNPNRNRHLEMVLKYVEFDNEGNVIPEYKEADEYNKRFLKSMTMPVDTEENIKAAKIERKNVLKDMMMGFTDTEEIVYHLKDSVWMLEHINEYQHTLGALLCLYDNMCQDILTKECVDEIIKENDELRYKLGEFNEISKRIYGSVNSFWGTQGYNLNTYMYVSEEDKESAEEVLDNNISIMLKNIQDRKEKNEYFEKLKKEEPYKSQLDKGETFKPTLDSYLMAKQFILRKDYLNHYSEKIKDEKKLDLVTSFIEVKDGQISEKSIGVDGVNQVKIDWFLKADDESRMKLIDDLIGDAVYVFTILDESSIEDSKIVEKIASITHLFDIMGNFEDVILKDDPDMQRCFETYMNMTKNADIKMKYYRFKDHFSSIRDFMGNVFKSIGYDIDNKKFLSEQEKSIAREEVDNKKGEIFNLANNVRDDESKISMIKASIAKLEELEKKQDELLEKCTNIEDVEQEIQDISTQKKEKYREISENSIDSKNEVMNYEESTTEKIVKKFKEYKNSNDNKYARKKKEKYVFKPSKLTYPIAVYYDKIKEVYSKYAGDEVYNKYVENVVKSGVGDGITNIDKNRNLEYVLRLVEYDSNGQVLPEYKEADEWNKKYIKAMTMDIGNAQAGTEAWKARKEIMIDLYNRMVNVDEILKNIDNMEWVSNNYAKIREIVAARFVYESNMLKYDPYNKAIDEEIRKENPELIKKYNDVDEVCKDLPMTLSQICMQLGFDVEKKDFVSEDEKIQYKPVLDFNIEDIKTKYAKVSGQ